MADTATLRIPFVQRGIATGTNLLQQFVGIGKAMEWALLTPTLSAQEAERWGLVKSSRALVTARKKKRSRWRERSRMVPR